MFHLVNSRFFDPCAHLSLAFNMVEKVLLRTLVLGYPSDLASPALTGAPMFLHKGRLACYQRQPTKKLVSKNMTVLEDSQGIIITERAQVFLTIFFSLCLGLNNFVADMVSVKETISCFGGFHLLPIQSHHRYPDTVSSILVYQLSF